MSDSLPIRMILVEDLVKVVKGRLLDKLVKNQEKYYKTTPIKCPDCKCDELVGVEIMGARNGVLLWECDKCFELFLKYEAEETEAELQKAKGFWTNANDWGYIPKSKFN